MTMRPPGLQLLDERRRNVIGRGRDNDAVERRRLLQAKIAITVNDASGPEPESLQTRKRLLLERLRRFRSCKRPA